MKSIMTMLALLSIGGGAPASAQSLSPGPSGIYRHDARTGVGLVVPLGGPRRNSAPRFELSLAQDRLGIDGRRIAMPRTRVGVSLDGNAALTINGRALPHGDERADLSTVGAVAIGLGVIVIAAAVWYVDAGIRASD